MLIREASSVDMEGIWPIFHDIVSAGTTYGFSPETSREDAEHLWLRLPQKTFVAEENGQILGTYYIKPNQAGPGSHVSNCGYMVSASARGRGLATAMCEHSQQMARQMGFLAMQFNFVASSNEVAVKLWQRLGFEIVGRLPKAFCHPSEGYVDALMMYKWL